MKSLEELQAQTFYSKDDVTLILAYLHYRIEDGADKISNMIKDLKLPNFTL